MLGHWQQTADAKGATPHPLGVISSGCRKSEAQRVFMLVGIRKGIQLIKLCTKTLYFKGVTG